MNRNLSENWETFYLNWIFREIFILSESSQHLIFSRFWKIILRSLLHFWLIISSLTSERKKNTEDFSPLAVFFLNKALNLHLSFILCYFLKLPSLCPVPGNLTQHSSYWAIFINDLFSLEPNDSDSNKVRSDSSNIALNTRCLQQEELSK